MASGFGSNCQVFCLPFTESHRTSNSANGGNSRTRTDEFTIPTTLHSQLYREYSNNYTNGIGKAPTIRPQSESTVWMASSLNGGDFSPIIQTGDSTLAGSNHNSHGVSPEGRTMRETHSSCNAGSAAGISKLFTRFGKRRKSSCDLREYFSDTEREVKGKNKGKHRWGSGEEKGSFWKKPGSREKLSNTSNLSAVDVRGYLTDEMSYRRDMKGRRVRKSISFDYFKDKVFSSTGSTPPRSRRGSQININENTHNHHSNSISFISDDESNGSRAGFTSMLGRKQHAVLYKLWIAVCQGNYNRAKYLLETSHISQSLFTESIQQDDMTLLDIALLTNHDTLILLLANCGFRESLRYLRDPLLRIAKFQDIIISIERQLMDLSESMMSGDGQKELERRITFNENKLRFYRVVNFAIQTIGSPSPPTEVTLSVRSCSSIQVSWGPPVQTEGGLVTRYLVQWERRETNFGFEGEHLITCLAEGNSGMRFTIPDLCTGVKYYVRVFAANVKGWSESAHSKPTAAAPSNWREWSVRSKVCSDPYSLESAVRLQKQTNQLIETCKEYCWRIANSDRQRDNQKVVTRLKNKGTAISRFFKTPLKFTRQVHASFYIGILIYTEHESTSKKDHYQILLTPEGCVPMVQLDQSVSSSLLTDLNVFQWLSLVISQWNSMKDVVYDLAGVADSNSVILRRKLLKILIDIQDSLGLKSIGSLHYVPIEQADGATIYCLVCRIDDLRSYQVTGGLKWSYIPSDYSKQEIQTKLPREGTEYHSIFSFMNMCPEIVEFHRRSRRKPAPGLYLSLFKLRTNTNHLSILSELDSVILFPSVRIRDNSNVSKEEWIWMQSIGTLKYSKSGKRRQVPDVNGVGSSLQCSIRQAWHVLRANLGLSQEQTHHYKLYTNEVIELSSEITIFFVLPAPCDVVTAPGVQDEFISNGANLTAIPLPSFKLLQLSFFHTDFFTKHAYISCILDLLGLIIGQKSKEAFSNEDLSEATNMLHQHALLKEMLMEMRKETNWIANVLKAARDQEKPCGISFMDLNKQFKNIEHEKHQIKSPVILPEVKKTNLEKQAGVIRVYPMYETGLAQGTSVKISCTHSTTAREIVHLVVQQLHSASVRAGLPHLELTSDQLDNFSLLSSVGSKVKLLDDSDQPLDLSDPWKQGKLYVTSKSDEPTSTTV